MKTRSGENVKLSDLLQEAVDTALQVVREKNPSLPAEEMQSVARAVGIGAVKYADLSQNRNNDYVFSFERMLSLNGNTAPYLQYAHARICSIFRKGGLDPEEAGFAFLIEHPSERALAKKLLEFSQAVEAVATDLRPHTLCSYLFDLATHFSGFYNECPVLTADSEKTKDSRLALCAQTKRILRTGLGLLGIHAPQEM